MQAQELCDTLCPPHNFTTVLQDAESGRVHMAEDRILPVMLHHGLTSISMRKFWWVGGGSTDEACGHV